MPLGNSALSGQPSDASSDSYFAVRLGTRNSFDRCSHSMAQLPLHYFRGPSLTFKVAWMNPYGWKLGRVAILYSALLHSAPVLLLSVHVPSYRV